MTLVTQCVIFWAVILLPRNSYNRLARAAVIVAIFFAAVGCRPQHVRPLAASPDSASNPGTAGANSVKGAPSNTKFGDDNGAPTTPQEIREEKAAVAVMDKLPDEENMSKDQMEKLIDDAKKDIPLDNVPIEPVTDTPAVAEPNVEPSSTPSITPSPVPSNAPGLLTDKTPKAAPPTHSEVWPAPKPSSVPIAPVTSPSPIPPAKPVTPPVKKPPVTKPSPIPSVIPNPPVDTDNGVDADDATYNESYTGPKTVVDHPMSSPDYQLSEIAAKLGMMTPKKSYLALQKSLMGSSLRSCNFFVDAALIEANLATSNSFPNLQAAAFDTKYFVPKGWKRVTLAQLKQAFKDHKTFDAAIQRDAPPGKAHGHVAIAIGLNTAGNVMIAEASYMTESNRISVYNDASLNSKFKIYVRSAEAL